MNLDLINAIIFFFYINPVYIISRIIIAIICFGVFLKHTGEFSRFIYIITFSYIIYGFFRGIRGRDSIFIQFNSTYLNKFQKIVESRQENTIIFRLFVVYSTIIIMIFFYGIAERFFFSKRQIREFALLVLSIHIGGLFVLHQNIFRDLLISLERVTLASYVLVTFERYNRFSTYAGIQYFIIGSFPTVRIIIGFSLLYQQTGSFVIQDIDLFFNNINPQYISIELNTRSSIFNNQLNFYEKNIFMNTNIWYYIKENQFFISNNMFIYIESIVSKINPITSIALIGLIFILFNLLFKLTAAPFHLWAPSIYGKAPIVTTTYLSIYSKIRIFFFLFKIRTTFFHAFSSITFNFILFCGIFSVFIGRIGAFTEKLIKRFFVFSSRGHVGFRLASISLSTIEGYSARFNYLIIYALSSFLRWFLLLTRGRDKHHLIHFVILKKEEPLLALIFAFLIFSRSGIPPLGGFFIKLDMLAVLLDNSHYLVNYILFFFTVSSFFYYLRIIKIIFFDDKFYTNNINNFNNNTYIYNEIPKYIGRLFIRIFIFIILRFYLFIIQKPILIAQIDLISFRN